MFVGRFSLIYNNVLDRTPDRILNFLVVWGMQRQEYYVSICQLEKKISFHITARSHECGIGTAEKIASESREVTSRIRKGKESTKLV